MIAATTYRHEPYHNDHSQYPTCHQQRIYNICHRNKTT
jgi:hypothetical protein